MTLRHQVAQQLVESERKSDHADPIRAAELLTEWVALNLVTHPDVLALPREQQPLVYRRPDFGDWIHIVRMMTKRRVPDEFKALAHQLLQLVRAGRAIEHSDGTVERLKLDQLRNALAHHALTAAQVQPLQEPLWNGLGEVAAAVDRVLEHADWDLGPLVEPAQDGLLVPSSFDDNRITYRPLLGVTTGHVRQLAEVPLNLARSRPGNVLDARSGRRGKWLDVLGVGVVNLVGQQELLGRVQQRLVAPGTTVTVLTGPGGIGKSAVARSVVEAVEDEFDHVALLDARNPADAVDTLARHFAEEVSDLQDWRDKAARLARRLDEDGTRWLIVLDNAMRYQQLNRDVSRIDDALHPLLVTLLRGGDGHVLVTSQATDWGRLHVEPVEALDREPAIDLLIAESGVTDRAGAARVVAKIGRVPLGLVIAGAYLRDSQRGFDDYLADVDAEAARLMAWDPGRDRGTLDDPNPVRSTPAIVYTLAVRRVCQLDPLAVEVLRLLSVFRPGIIPLGLFDEVIADHDLLHRPGRVRLDEALARLQRASLLTLQAQRLESIGPPAAGGEDQAPPVPAVRLATLHELISLTVRHLVNDRQVACGDAAGPAPELLARGRLLELAVNALDEAFPDDVHDPAERDRLRLLLPQARYVGAMALEHEGLVDAVTRDQVAGTEITM